jgi:hypothetical protein
VPPRSVMKSRRLMGFVLQVEDRTLAYRWASAAACNTAKWDPHVGDGSKAAV